MNKKTKRQTPLQTLKESEERLQFALEGSNEGVWDWNVRTGEVFFSKQWKEMLGYEDQEIGNHLDEWSRRVHPDDMNFVMAEIEKHFSGKTPFYACEHRIQCKDGRYKWILDRGKIFARTEDGKPLRMVGTHIDITDQKGLREELYSERKRFQTIADNMPFGMIMIDRNNRYTYVNPKFTELFGYDLKDIPDGRIWFRKAFPDKDYRQEVIKTWINDFTASNRGEGKTRTFTIQCKDGAEKIAAIASVHIKSGEYIIAFMDITERKKAEEALRESEERYRIAIEHSNDGVSIIGQDLIHIYVSNRYTEIFGYDNPDEIIGQPVERIVHPSDRERVRRYGTIRQQGGYAPARYEFTGIKKDRTPIYAEVSVTMITYKGQRSLLAYLRDITDRKNAEESLRKSEERYRNIFENTMVGIFQSTPAGRYINVNPALATMHGFDSSEDMIYSVTDIGQQIYVRPEDRIRYMELLEKNNMTRGYESPLYRKDRSIIWISMNVMAIRDGNGTILYYEGFVEDITERKKAENALKESEEKYRNIFENAVEGIFQSTPEGRFISVNPAMTKMCGFDSPEEMISSIRDIAHEHYTDPAQRITFRQIIEQQGSIENFEHQTYRKDGKRIWVSTNSRAVRDQEGRTLYYEGTYQDITSRKQDEEEKARLQAQFFQAQKMEAVGTLAGGIAHDFNNLLMGIQGYASLMLYNMEINNPNYEKLKNIEDLVRSGAELTKQLLGFARGGKYTVKPADLNEIIEKTSVMFGRTKKEIAIHKKYAEDLYAVEVDQGQFEQVLLNLYVNAWQAMPAGGTIYIETTNAVLDAAFTRPYSVKPGRYVKVSITDTGSGMDEKTKERIFEPFFTTKEMGRGTGLGLASAYGIIKNHQGIIEVISEEGEGSTFIIYLPASGKQAIKEIRPSGTIVRGKETILIVDDEETILRVSSELLTMLGYKVLAAQNGKDALNIYGEHRSKIDLVILDMIMPDMGGEETFRLLKAMKPGIRVILSSGYSMNGHAKKILDQGCKAFLQKPFNIDELSQKIRYALETSE
jgi:two-component system cell cycle sensor histidine kinase/response regulator CckA